MLSAPFSGAKLPNLQGRKMPFNPSLPPTTCSWTSLQQLKDVQLRGKLIQTKSNYCGSDTCKPKSRPVGQRTESRPARYNRTYWTMSHKWVSVPATPPVPPQHRAATGTNRTREPRTPEHRLQHVSRGCFFILKQYHQINAGMETHLLFPDLYLYGCFRLMISHL